MKRNDHNIIGVDYGILANDSYIKVVKNAPLVGTGVAMALDEMVKSGFNPEKLHIVGHSMGSQVAGHVGRKATFQVPRITGKILYQQILLQFFLCAYRYDIKTLADYEILR